MEPPRRIAPAAVLTALAVLTILIAACGSEQAEPPAPADDARAESDPGPVHVHGLGVNPRDGALFIATHTGLFRVRPGGSKATRVADRWQDTMGFTVVGPDHFLGSGHPDGREKLPPFLGLIRSRDAGRSWRPVSLLGKTDFHVLEASGSRIYGFGSDWRTRRSQFLVSSDGGSTWKERAVPAPLVSLAVHPRSRDRIVAASAAAIHGSTDGGETWRRLGSGSGLLAWRSAGELVMVGMDGDVKSSPTGSRWREVGDVGGHPGAFEAERDGLYVALHDGTIKRSIDGGSSWSVRSRP